MGYKGSVILGHEAEILDMISDIKKTIGKEIEIGFYPDIPKDEKRYLLKDAKVGIDVRGAYIHFFLQKDDKTIEFIINGIKSFEYDINPTFRKYWVSTSEDLLTVPEEGQTSIKVQKGNKVFRFMLFINEND
ncbi:MAG: hypothetical protein IMW94_10485 [Thermoanaerobacter sp.]|nr:hypothetical protein [Thermoanaerobacter sp.]